jgi:hypothetical protein
MNAQPIEDYESLPKSGSYRLLDFEWAEVVTLESFPPQYLLRVGGTKPYANMRVDLSPLVYVRQPEYWGIEVVGRLRGGIPLPAEVPYEVSLPLSGITGTRGVEVIGASHSEKLEVPCEGLAGNCGGWSAWHDHEPPGPPVLHVRGECEFPTAGFSVELRRHEPQGFNPRDLLLDRIVREPSGPVPQVITVVEARYREETDFEFDTVTILPDGVLLQVQEVS